MIACMSRDPYIMGLCGETKIANKGDSWVTAIQGNFTICVHEEGKTLK